MPTLTIEPLCLQIGAPAVAAGLFPGSPGAWTFARGRWRRGGVTGHSLDAQ